MSTKDEEPETSPPPSKAKDNVKSSLEKECSESASGAMKKVDVPSLDVKQPPWYILSALVPIIE